MANFETPVSTYMSTPIVAIRSKDSLTAARRSLADHDVSALPVVDEKDRVVGVISRTDLLRVGRRDAGSRQGSPLLTLPDRKVADDMTQNVAVVPSHTSLAETAKKMVQERIHRVVVTEGDVPVGVLSTLDLMRVIRDKRVNYPISDIMSSPLFTVRASEPLSLATDRLAKARVTGLVVVDEDWPVGVFTQEEALDAGSLPRDTPVEEAMSPAILILDARTPVHRAAAQAGALHARRVIVSKDGEPVGIVSGLDFASLVS